MEPQVKIVVGSDHAGFSMKNFIAARLRETGYDVIDVGTDSEDSCDYPVFARAVCDTVVSGGAKFGILCCGTGIGMSIAANKVRGIRAAVCSDAYSTQFTRAHNDSNVLCLGARVIGEEFAWSLAKIFLDTSFEGGKHARRVALISDIENDR